MGAKHIFGELRNKKTGGLYYEIVQKSDLDVVITPYTYDGVALVQQTIIFPAGQMKVIGPTITRIVGGIEINSITPEYDDTYSYIIAEQTTKNA